MKIDYQGYAGVRYSQAPYGFAVIFALLALGFKMFARGMAFAVIFFAVLAVIFFVYGFLGRLAQKSSAAKIARLIIRILFLIWFLSFVIVEILIVTGMKDDTFTSADYVIVLGAGVYGETPSPVLSGRLSKAEEYLLLNDNAIVILSGGQGPGENITEAEAMYRRLETFVDPERIIKEENSTSTNENLKFSGEIIRRLEGEAEIKACIITSDFHLFRTRILAKRHGIEPVCIGSHLPLPLNQATLMLREYFAVINTVMFLNR